MTARADARRERIAIRIGFAAVLMAALAFAAVMRDAASRQVEAIDGLVAPSWSDDFVRARTVRIVSRDAELTLERDAETWRLREREGHEVSSAALTELHRALTAMRFAGARTNDPANHERLGVVAPEDGGAGVRLALLDAQGEALVDLIVGDARARGFFVRRPGEEQAYAVDGALPDVASAAFWLDLDFLPLARGDIRQVDITPGGGGLPYRLVRASRTEPDFALGQPSAGWVLITAGAANGPGGAAAELRFVDVAPADAVPGTATAQHTVRTFDGLEITLSLIERGGATWARIDASAENDGAQATADALDARTAGWVYQLPEYAPERLARQLDRIARSETVSPEPEASENGD